MKYSVVIPSLYKVDKDYLELCVTSLRDSGFDGDIIVVTNGTKAPEPLNIEGITRRLHTKDQGQCVAVNIGMQAVNTEYALISNSDMYYAPDWDYNLKFDYPVFSPNLIEPTNNNGSAPPFLKLDAGVDLDEFKPDVVNTFVYHEIDKNSSVEAGFNLPLFIRKDIWQTIGGYDIKYDPWGSGSDTDLQMKIELAGIKPMRLNDVLVYHFSNKSGTFDGTHQEEWWKNWSYLESKWGFNRDEAKSDTWYCKNMIMYDKLKFHPSWEGKYSDES